MNEFSSDSAASVVFSLRLSRVAAFGRQCNTADDKDENPLPVKIKDMPLCLNSL